MPTIIFYRQKQEKLKEALSQRYLPLTSEETQTGYKGSRPVARNKNGTQFSQAGGRTPRRTKNMEVLNG
jgi:hypothetical protein